MRTLITIILAAILGIATGVGNAVLRLDETVRGNLLLPEVVVDATEHDFGTLDIHATGSQAFRFTNAGEGMLVLTTGRTSCRCTVSNIERPRIPPGESGLVTLTWTPNPNEGAGPYRQSVTILTNDPKRREVTLTISGRIIAAVQAVPAELVFSRLPAGEAAVGEILLYCYVDKPLGDIQLDFTDPYIAKYFEASAGPLPPDLLEEEEGARSGRLIRITVKPGIPVGPFRQAVRVKTGSESPSTIEVPVFGTVVQGDFSASGVEAWDGQGGLLDFVEPVNSAEGAQREFSIVVRGPYRKQVKLELLKKSPDLLDVKLGEPVPVGDGRAIRTPLIVRIPEGSPPSTHLGSETDKLGEILLKTNHPHISQLTIRVRFAIAE